MIESKKTGIFYRYSSGQNVLWQNTNGDNERRKKHLEEKVYNVITKGLCRYTVPATMQVRNGQNHRYATANDDFAFCTLKALVFISSLNHTFLTPAGLISSW